MIVNIDGKDYEISNEGLELLNKGFKYNPETGEFEETEESKNVEKQKFQNELESITNDLVNINGKIEGAKKLKEMGIFDEDDEVELVGYQTKVKELIIARSEIKAKLKVL